MPDEPKEQQIKTSAPEFLERYWWDRTPDPLMRQAQFTSEDVQRVTGLTAKALEHIIDPKKDRVRLDTPDVAPGRGRRRLFTGEDVLKIQAATIMSDLGLPQRFSSLLTDDVVTRSRRLRRGGYVKRGHELYFWPGADGDWVVLRWFAELGDVADHRHLPVAVHALNVDRLIEETTAKLAAIVNDEPLPDFEVPEPAKEENDDPLMIWDQDERGRPIRVGLTHEETVWYEEQSARSLEGEDDPEGRDRWLELYDKHEEARLARVSRLYGAGGDDG